MIEISVSSRMFPYTLQDLAMHSSIYLLLNAYWRPLLVLGNSQPNMSADPPTCPPSPGLRSSRLSPTFCPIGEGKRHQLPVHSGDLNEGKISADVVGTTVAMSHLTTVPLERLGPGPQT